MHTFWFLCVYAVMAVGRDRNTSLRFVLAKIAGLVAIIALIFETGQCPTVFRPLHWVLSYQGSMHEWCFRSGLDRYATPVGMLVGVLVAHPEAAALRAWLVALPPPLVFSAALAPCVGYGFALLGRDKYTYNAIHPYLSMIPVVGYLLARNSLPWLRRRCLGAVGLFGRLSLEIYLLQHHVSPCPAPASVRATGRRYLHALGPQVWLKRNAKVQLELIRANHHMNFMLTSLQLVLLGHATFEATNRINSWLVKALG